MNSDNAGRGLNIVLGILLIILGLVVLGAQVFTTLATTYFLGWLLVIGGIFEFFGGIFSGRVSTALLSMFAGILTGVVGAILIVNPTASALVLTILMSIVFIVIGAMRMGESLFSRQGNWGLTFIGGFLVLLLGLIIMAQWPVSGLYIIGLFLGLEFIVSGIALTVSGFGHSEEQAVQQTTAPAQDRRYT